MLSQESEVEVIGGIHQPLNAPLQHVPQLSLCHAVAIGSACWVGECWEFRAGGISYTGVTRAMLRDHLVARDQEYVMIEESILMLQRQWLEGFEGTCSQILHGGITLRAYLNIRNNVNDFRWSFARLFELFFPGNCGDSTVSYCFSFRISWDIRTSTMWPLNTLARWNSLQPQARVREPGETRLQHWDASSLHWGGFPQQISKIIQNYHLKIVLL